MKARKHALGLVFVLAVLGVALTLGVFFYLSRTVDRSGWMERGGQYYYLDERGQPTSGWYDEEGSRYYFGTDGAMVTGWQMINGSRYWFSPAGVMRTGWLEEDDGLWYLDPNPVTGWQNVDGEMRYFLPDGMLAVGWQEIDGQRYHLSDSGVPMKGWLDLQEGTYFLNEDGHLVTGLTQLDGKSYYFYEGSGLLHQGWLDFGTDRFYFGTDGAMVTGWQEIDGRRSYFDESGTLHRGWLQQGEYRYYLLDDGTAAVSPTEIDGRMEFFTPDGINVLLVNYRYPVPQSYKVDLVRYGEWARVASIAEQHLRQMILDCRATGIQCWLNCGYRTHDEQIAILDERTQEYVDKGMSREEAKAKALETVAVPGYSEHETGLAMDIVCSVDPVWLQEHCWEYGFILRYPEGKSAITNISYEHWHYRYVGTEVSMKMKGTGLCLEEYLGAA